MCDEKEQAKPAYGAGVGLGALRGFPLDPQAGYNPIRGGPNQESDNSSDYRIRARNQDVVMRVMRELESLKQREANLTAALTFLQKQPGELSGADVAAGIKSLAEARLL